jgi:hypothetical protein
VIACLAAAGCGGDGVKRASSPLKSVPYPNGPWSAVDQGGFFGACEGGKASRAYCVCALKYVMQHYPNTSRLPGSRQVGGTAAVWVYGAQVGLRAKHEGDFPACAGK